MDQWIKDHVLYLGVGGGVAVYVCVAPVAGGEEDPALPRGLQHGPGKQLPSA